MKPILFILSTLLIFVACEDPFDTADNSIPDSLIKNSTFSFPGEVVETTSANKNGVRLWQITIENEYGSMVKFYWRKSSSNLHSIEGTKGPFDYNLKPPYDVLNLATARFLATNNYTIGNITSWSFEPSLTENMKWFYTFHGDGDTPKVILDAGNGSIIR